MPDPTCPYCGGKAILRDSAVLYGRSYGNAWVCEYYPDDCDAYVGCHKNSDVPLGRLADAELRAAKKRAHAWFDPLWRGGGVGRSKAYRWLARQLGIPEADCHIGMFDVAQCKRVCRVMVECEQRVMDRLNAAPS